MSDEHAFLEGHYYSGGLHHHTYSDGQRPTWAPQADIVGFRDEFQLDRDDSVVELRRFKAGDSRISWVGVFYKSVDAKFGDRGNHAGMGAWFRDVVPFDFVGLLAGLEQLARSISEDVDPQALEPDAKTFRSSQFLPSYAIGRDLAPSIGFAFGDVGIVDSRLYQVVCSGTPSDCAPLTDFLIRVSLLQRDPLPPRLLVHATARSLSERADVTELVGFTAAPALVRLLPDLLSRERERADGAEREVADFRKRLETIEEQHGRLQLESHELEKFRDDPLRHVSLRLDGIEDSLRTVLSERRAGISSPAPTQSIDPFFYQRRNPITRQPSTDHFSSPTTDETAWLPGALLLFVAFCVVALLIMLGFRYLPALWGQNV